MTRLGRLGRLRQSRIARRRTAWVLAAIGLGSLGGRGRAAEIPDAGTGRHGAAAEVRGKVEHWDLARIREEMKQRRGRPLVIHLWASWCGPCLEELPSIETFARKARSHGIGVVSLSLDTAANSDERVTHALAQLAPSLTSVVADFDDPAAFGALFTRSWEGSIPALFAFDSAGGLQRSVVESVPAAQLDRLLARLIHDAGPPRSADKTKPAPAPAPR
jgi:thiol-disulfide isomerase/thioredoxin